MQQEFNEDKVDDPFDVDPDDEIQPVTDPYVVETLGVDPLDLFEINPEESHIDLEKPAPTEK